MNAYRIRLAILVTLGAVALGVLFFLPRQPQDPAYHQFADQRTILCVPHSFNVLSNLPFCIVGLLGLWQVWHSGRDRFLESAERWPYAVLFAGVALTGIGSSYYHLDPTNARLVWDRLPITVAFMGFFAAMIAERVSVRAGTWLLGPLVALGAFSVFHWHEGELRGEGDLRLYFFVQFYPLAATPLLLLLFPPRYTGSAYVWAALGCYLLAKVVEIPRLDHDIMAATGLMSGHTLKHLFAALGAYWLARMLQTRRPAIR